MTRALMSVVHDGVSRRRGARDGSVAERERRARADRRRPDGPRARQRGRALGPPRRARRAPAARARVRRRTRRRSPGTGASPGRRASAPDWRAVLDDPEVEAVYIAVPHHLHAELYVAALDAGKHLLGEKPFGIDLAANETIMRAVAGAPRPSSCAARRRCRSSPAARRSGAGSPRARFGRPIEVRSLFLHSSDLDPGKADQLEAPRRDQWRLRLPRRPRHARTAPAAAGRLGAARRARRCSATSFKERPDGRGGTVPVRHPRQRGPAVPRRARGRRVRRCASRPSGSRRAT